MLRWEVNLYLQHCPGLDDADADATDAGSLSQYKTLPDRIRNTYLSAVHAIIQHDAMDIPVLHTDDLPSSLSRLAGNCLGQVSSSPFLCFYAQFHCRWTTHGRILLEDSIHFLMARSRACFFSTLAAEAENERPPSPQHCSSTR